MNPSSNIIKVTIYGTEYPIKGDSDVQYIQKVAKYVDEKMYEVDRNTSSKSTLKVAILTALNIADELFREKADKDVLIRQFEDRISKLSSLITSIEDQGESKNLSDTEIKSK